PVLPAEGRRAAGAGGGRRESRGHRLADRARLAAPPLARDAADPGDALPRAPAREPRRPRDRAQRRRVRRPGRTVGPGTTSGPESGSLAVGEGVVAPRQSAPLGGGRALSGARAA